MKSLIRYPETADAGGVQMEAPGIQPRLENEKARLERRLAQINAALDALKQQPTVAELLETVMRAL